MPPIVNASGISKQFGIQPLFQNISITISEGDRIGLIGPNGSGKSTLLSILSGRMEPDSGELAIRKRTRTSYVAQNSEFAPGETVGSIIEKAAAQTDHHDGEHASHTAETLGRAGFTDLSVPADTLSGGWKKRLAIVEGLVQAPDILFLDEPTNHLDLAGIKWIESVLADAACACVIVSHDRYLLENVAADVVELNRIYGEGLLRVRGNYSMFLEARDAYLYAQGKYRESLTNRVRSEVEWLRRGAKARTSKSKARIGKAQDMIGELADLNQRTRVERADIDFSATDRKSKMLIELDKVSASVGGRLLFQNFEFTVKAGMRVGLVGPNGSGKTTFLNLMHGKIDPAYGKVRRADGLRIVVFDQKRELDPRITLKRALAPESDSVVYQDRAIHVAAWADRFLFPSEALNQPVGRLSGGERARVLIAQLMLQPADVLLLDEPTNDLDIPTLEVLENSLTEFPGAMVLVTHDRYLLDRVSTIVIGLDGLGGVGLFADHAQWDAWQRERTNKERSGATPNTSRGKASQPRKKLSYAEAREFGSIAQRIAEAEKNVSDRRSAFQDPSIASDAARLIDAEAQVNAAQAEVDRLYARWLELEQKQE